MESIIAWVGEHPHLLAVSIFLVSFFESLAVVGVIVPGVVLLFGLSALSGSGAMGLTGTLFAAFAGAVVGDGLSFYLGRLYGSIAFQKWPLNRYPEMTRQAERFFLSHGGKSIMIGRFVGPIRPVMPFFAGTMNMPAGRFVGFNVASAVAWAPWYVLPGFFVGAAVDTETPLPPLFYPVLFSLIGVVFFVSAVFAQLHWHFRPQGRLYRWLMLFGRKFPRLRALWRRSYSVRNGVHEYPISSVLLFLVGSSAFALVSWMTIHLPTMLQLNSWARVQLEHIHIFIMDLIFVGLTLLGDPDFLYLIFGWFILILLFKRQLMLAGLTIATGLATHAFTVLFKNAFALARPDSVFLPETYAYPSGHTTGAIVVYGIITAFLARERLPHRRWPVYMTGLSLALLIGTSRLYLGVHWLADVVGGVFLGATICGLSRFIQSHFDREIIWDPIAIRWLAGGALCLTLGYLGVFYMDALEAFQQNTPGTQIITPPAP